MQLADNGINVYGRFGLDVISRYNKIKNEDTGEALVKGKVALEIFLEVIKDINKNAELEFGLGYVWHGKRDYNAKDKKLLENSKNFPLKTPCNMNITGVPNFAIFPIFLNGVKVRKLDSYNNKL